MYFASLNAAMSLIPQRFHRVELGRAPGGVEHGKEAGKAFNRGIH